MKKRWDISQKSSYNIIMNKMVIRVLLFIISSSLIFPQDNSYPVDLEVVSQIREEGLNNSDLPQL